MQATLNSPLDLRQVALDPDAWLEPLRQLYRRVGGFCAQLQFVRLADGRLLDNFAPEFPVSAVDAYRDYYGQISPRRDLAVSLGVGSVFACNDHFDRSFVARNEFYQDFAVRYGPRHMLGVMLALRHGVAAVLGLLRAPDAPAFQFDEKEFLRQQLAQLRPAAELHIEMAMLRSRTQLGHAALSAFPYPVFVVNDAAVPDFINPAGRQLLELGHCLRIRGSKLAPAAATSSADFANAVMRATAPQNPATTHLLMSQHGSQGVANVLVAPVDGGIAAGGWRPTLAMVVLRVQENGAAADFAAIAKFFDFTPTEARIAEHLLNGLAVDAIARELGIASSTVRWHFKALFEKAGVSRQAEFVAALRQLCG